MTAHRIANKTVSAYILNGSDRLLRLERRALMFLMAWLIVLVLLNVVTRQLRMPLYWVDEACVYSVVWLTFIGASAMTRLKMDFAVTMLTDKLPTKAQALSKVAASCLVFAFGLAMLTMCWLWMDPIGIAKAGFDARVFSGATFNFLYSEKTQTLNWPVWLVQLIMPIFSATFTLHALANLIEESGLQACRTHHEFQLAAIDGVN